MAKPFILLLGFALLAIAGCAHSPIAATKVSDAQYFGETKVKRYELFNGLKVLILEDHSAPTFAYYTWYNVGSKDEQHGLTGLAHLFEHMMFKQTKTLKDGEFDRILESAGAEGENAFTSKDYTAYVQSLPSDKLELIAKLESDRMINLLVNEEALNKEREVVQNERRMRTENSPNGLLYERLYEMSFNKHSYHWPVIGYEQDLRNAKSQQCEAFYKRFYAPNNATIALVGDVNPSSAIKVIEKYYGQLPASKIERPARTPEPKQDKERVTTRQIKSPVEKVMIGYRIPNVNAADFAAIEITRNILGGGRSSRLYRKMVDSGIASSVELESAEHGDPGLMLIFITLQKDHTAKESLAVLDKEINGLVNKGARPEEIERSVSMHRFAVFDEQASNSSKAHFLGFYETVAGRFERGVEIVNALRAVDNNAIIRAARTYLNKDNRTVIIGEKGK